MGRAVVEETGSRPREEKAAEPLRTSPDHGPTVPVQGRETALSVVREVPGSETVDPLEQAGLNHWQDSSSAALSLRREFQSNKADGLVTDALAEDIGASTGRSRKSKKVGWTGQYQPSPVTPPPGTGGMACSASVLADIGMAGLVSANLPPQGRRRPQ